MRDFPGLGLVLVVIAGCTELNSTWDNGIDDVGGKDAAMSQPDKPGTDAATPPGPKPPAGTDRDAGATSSGDPDAATGPSTDAGADAAVTAREGCDDPQTFYADADGDGYGVDDGALSACSAPDGYVAQSGDCDDDCATCFVDNPESCDGHDNDCDTQVDEETDEVCGSATGACATGMRSCVDGVLGACTGGTDAVDEVCDGATDEDCDDTIDEGCPCQAGDSRDCGSNVGACKLGSQSCMNGAWGPCTGGVTPSDEICDNVNNDCDGATDEGLTRACGSDVGECVAGIETCSAGVYGGCTATGPASEIWCNGKDEDCDNETDEQPSNKANCGSCNYACAGSLACNAGVCAQIATRLSLGYLCSCALTGSADANGAFPVSCWGTNTNGQLKIATSTSYRATPDVLPGGKLRDIGIGRDFACAIDDTSDDVTCWGKNDLDQLGTGDAVSSYTFTVSGVTGIDTTDTHSCLTMLSGGVLCFGDTFTGSLPGGGTAYPGSTISGVSGAVQVEAGYQLSCSRTAAGAVQCWGTQYGDNGRTAHTITNASGTALTGATRISANGMQAAGAHACAIRSDKTVACWGTNAFGELGVTAGTGNDSTKYKVVSGVTNVVAITTGAAHSCALTGGGQVYCWGSYKESTSVSPAMPATYSTAPVAVSGLSDIVDIEAGATHTCAKRRSGQVVCWGQNTDGELGDGTTSEREGLRNVSGMP